MVRICVTAANSVLICSKNASINSWVTVGFAMDCAQALMEPMLGDQVGSPEVVSIG